MSEFSPIGGNEGYGVCADDRMAKGHWELRGAVPAPLQIRSDTSLPQRVWVKNGRATSNKEEINVMHITDPIADMLTRIRNASNAKHETVDVPASNMKKSIAQILLDEGYIKNFQVIDDNTQGVIRITLKYLPGKEKAIQGLRRVSKPGLRVYAGADELPRVLRGLGIAIISTSKGVMTDKAARTAHVGGEVLAFVW